MRLHTPPVGWGAVLLISGKMHTAAGQWFLPTLHHINTMELKALHQALQFFEKYLNRTQINWYADNVTALANLRSGRSNSFQRNALVTRIFALTEKLQSKISGKYVNTCKNPADRLSRFYEQRLRPSPEGFGETGRKPPITPS